MVAVPFVFLLILLISKKSDGKRTSSDSSTFFCGDGSTVEKHQWCDGSTDCDDHEDETHCNNSPWYGINCDHYVHFRCGNEKCIPKEGRCDGYLSCSDGSDEYDCPCDELHDAEGKIEYKALIGSSQEKCWKVFVYESQYLNLTIRTEFYTKDCSLGNITIRSTSNSDNGINFGDIVICPSNTSTQLSKLLTFYSDIEILYRTEGTEPRDFFSITYNTADTACLNIDAFKCYENTCILSEKECDGHEDCTNGLDEQNCRSLTAEYLEINRRKAIQWMKSQRNADWGWKDNTHRAVVALYLGDALNFNGSSKEDDLIAKQLELETSTYLLRSKIDKISLTEMSAFINALLVICHDPRNFYGFDLISNLKEEIENAPGYAPPFLYLTLCNAKEPISEDVVNHLLQYLENSSNHGFVLEIQSLAIMALSCISSDNQYVHLKRNISEALNNLKKEQMEDGSFGNEYTTALVLQALIANNQAKKNDWNLKASVEFLRQKQEENGSFGDFLTTYLVMPILNVKSLVDVGKVNCTESLKRPRDGNLVSDIKSRLGGKVPAKYSLFIGDERDQIHPIVLRTPENITVLELMALAADIDPKYKFKTHQIKKKTYVYEISSIPNDPVNNKFWFLYQSTGNDTVPTSTQSPDEIRLGENDHVIIWYKTLDFM